MDWNAVTAWLNQVSNAVDQGTRAAERFHLETADRPFGVLEAIPGFTRPAQLLHAVHDVCVGGVYLQVRVLSRLAVLGLKPPTAATGPSPRVQGSEPRH